MARSGTGRCIMGVFFSDCDDLLLCTSNPPWCAELAEKQSYHIPSNNPISPRFSNVPRLPLHHPRNTLSKLDYTRLAWPHDLFRCPSLPHADLTHDQSLVFRTQTSYMIYIRGLTLRSVCRSMRPQLPHQTTRDGKRDKSALEIAK